MLQRLPVELLELVLEQCFPEDLLALRLVHQRLADIVRDDIDRLGLASIRIYYQPRAQDILDDYKPGRKPRWLRFMTCKYLASVMAEGFRKYASEFQWRDIQCNLPLGRTRETLHSRFTSGWWLLSRLAYVAQTCEKISTSSLRRTSLWRRPKNAGCSFHRSREHPACLRKFIRKELSSRNAADINLVLQVRDTTICPCAQPKNDLDDIYRRHSGLETRTGLLRLLQRGGSQKDPCVSDFWRWEYAHILGGPALFASQWVLSSQDESRAPGTEPGRFEREYGARSAETAQRDRDRAIFVRQLLKQKAVGPDTVHLALFEPSKYPAVWQNDLVPVWITLPD